MLQLEKDIKAFYDKNHFPGKYSADDLLEYYNENRYLNFIGKYILFKIIEKNKNMI